MTLAHAGISRPEPTGPGRRHKETPCSPDASPPSPPHCSPRSRSPPRRPAARPPPDPCRALPFRSPVRDAPPSCVGAYLNLHDAAEGHPRAPVDTQAETTVTGYRITVRYLTGLTGTARCLTGLTGTARCLT